MNPFVLVKDHVLLKYASGLAEVDAKMAELFTPVKLASIVQLIPDSWLADDAEFTGTAAQREAYVKFFTLRMRSSHIFLQEALRARSSYL
jgi:hypothetical protein